MRRCRVILLVDPATVATLDRGDSCAHVTTAFLASSTYRDLVREAGR
jgi:hypothetical protein